MLAVRMYGVRGSALAQSQEAEWSPVVTQTADPAVGVTQGTLQSAGMAATEVSTAVKSGGEKVVLQGRGLWQDVVVPMLSRMANALPSVIKAVILLVAFWILAVLVGAVHFDQRAGKYFPTREIKGVPVGPCALIGRLFFYVILLFGIPPFLQALG